MKQTLLLALLLSSFLLFSQDKENEVELQGEVFDEYLEPFVGALVKTSDGKSTTSDYEGKFKVKSKLPVTITVSYIGYSTEEILVSSIDDQIGVILKENSGLDQIVLSATRTPERLFESPVTIRRMSLNDIKKTPSLSFYDAMENLRNVDMKTNSILLKSINTKGISSIRNKRFVQLIDGVDNVFPQLGISPGNMVGLVDMDVENVEILEGASSAMYGSNAFNGVLSIRSKNPFDYKGISVKLQGGVMKQKSGNEDPFYNPSVRFAYKFSDKFATKVSFSYHVGHEWERDDRRNIKIGVGVDESYKVSDEVGEQSKNYDGVNVYGDEYTLNEKTLPFLNLTAKSVEMGLKMKPLTEQLEMAKKQGNTQVVSALMGKINELKNSFMEAKIAMALAGSEMITRDGVPDKYLTDNENRNLKFNASLHYRPLANTKLELIWTSRLNQAKGFFDYGAYKVYNDGIKLNQHILEVKGESFFLRGYQTNVNGGKTYALNHLGSLALESWKGTKQWFQEYMREDVRLRTGAFMKAKGFLDPTKSNYTEQELLLAKQKLAGAIIKDSALPEEQRTLFKDFNWDLIPTAQIDALARMKANQGMIKPGSAEFNSILSKIRGTRIPEGGAWFHDQSKMYNVEGNFNFAKYIDFAEIQVGGTFRKYLLNSYGNISRTIDEVVEANEYGLYTQIRKKLLDKRFDITASARYDKSDELEGLVSPRLSLAYTMGENRNHSFRVSVQKAYRQPSIEERYSMFILPGNRFIIGNTKRNRERLNAKMRIEKNHETKTGEDKYIVTDINNEFISKIGFVETSMYSYYKKFLSRLKNSDYTFNQIIKRVPDFTLLETDKIQDELRSEQLLSFEAGYRGMIDVSSTNILELDVSGYYNKYRDFIRMATLYIPGRIEGPIQPDAGDKVGQQAAGGRNIKTMNDLLTSPFALAVMSSFSVSSAKVTSPKNSSADVNTYGIGLSAKMRLWDNYKVALNYAWNDFDYAKNGDKGFVPTFNASKHNIKLMFGNENVFKNIGFNIAGRWQSGYHWHSEIVKGEIDARTVVDAQISYSIPKLKSRFKLGGINLFGKPYYDTIGNGSIGNVYYLSWIIND